MRIRRIPTEGKQYKSNGNAGRDLKPYTDALPQRLDKRGAFWAIFAIWSCASGAFDWSIFAQMERFLLNG